MAAIAPARLARLSDVKLAQELRNKRLARRKVADGTVAARYLDMEIEEWAAEQDARETVENEAHGAAAEIAVGRLLAATGRAF